MAETSPRGADDATGKVRSLLHHPPLTGLSQINGRNTPRRGEVEPRGQSIHRIALQKKALSSPVLLVGSEAPTHALSGGSSETRTGPQDLRRVVKVAADMYSPPRGGQRL